jgi:uncharacterized membrane-anchored protein
MKAFFGKVWAKIKAFFAGLAQFFKNKAEQFSIEEVLKFAAGAAGIYLGYRFFFGSFADGARQYFWQAEAILWGYALAQGIAHNVTKQ